MENNTAPRLTAETVINEFKSAHSNLDLLKVFLITGAADISRSYEFINRLNTNAKSDDDRAKYTNALKTLENIELKRIELTEVIYSANSVQIAEIAETEESGKSIMMLPSLDDILERVKSLLNEPTEAIHVNKRQAFELLKTSVGQGKVINSKGKAETWDNVRINTYIEETAKDVVSNEDAKVEKTDNQTVKIGFEKVYDQIVTMIEAGKLAPEIKEIIKSFMIGKVIGGEDAKNDYFIKDEAIFEDYYKRMIENVIIQGIIAFNNKTLPVVNKAEKVEEVIKTEIEPLLKELDKDETKSEFVTITKMFRDIYKKVGLNISLPDALLKVKEIAATIAPNLVLRNKNASKGNIPLISIDYKKMADTGSEDTAVEIYDEAHNIKESNPELWEEVKNYEYLTQLFDKATELWKMGKWQDALSMSIILISSGKIRESKSVPKLVKWDTDETKLWYYNTVEVVEKQPETQDIEAEVIDEATTTENKVETNNSESNAKVETKAIEELPKNEKSSGESSKKTGEAKQGPVAQVGSIENITEKPLKDNSLWKDTYSFKGFTVKTDHYRGGKLNLEIVDATPEQEKDLLITETNMTNFLNEQRMKLVENQNNYPTIKVTLTERLNAFYEFSNSEIKRLMGQLSKEAEEMRKELKTANVDETKVVKPKVTETKTEEVKETTEEKVETKVVTPNESTEDSQDMDDKSEDTETTEKAVTTEETKTEEVSDNISYEGYEEILKAKGKHDMNVAIFNKVSEFENTDEGIKAVYEIVNIARKDGHYKKSMIRNYKGNTNVELLGTIKKIVEIGSKVAE